MLEIKLIGINDILDVSYMFYTCLSLISIKELSKWNINKTFNLNKCFINVIH